MVPSVTFFDKDFVINLDIHRLLIKHILINGADAIYLFNSNPEHNFFIDKQNEKIRLISLCSEIVGNKVPLLIGISGTTVDNFIEQIDTLGKKFNTANFAIIPSSQEKSEDITKHLEDIVTGISVSNSLLIDNYPTKFTNNGMNPEIIQNLLHYDNFSGIIDPFLNINYCKAYSKLISDNFSYICGNEPNLHKFFQMIPLELRSHVGIVPSISNIINLPSKLYYYAIEDKILEMHQLQEQINDIRAKIYDFKSELGKEERGLKYAFFSIYKNNFSRPINDYYDFIPEINPELELITKNRIEATVNYLINQKQIYQLYFLGKTEAYQFKEIIEAFSNIDILLDQGKIKRVSGPLKSNNNTLYKVNFEKNTFLFRFYTSHLINYEDAIKEKLLYPLLNNSLDPKSPQFKEQVKEIIYNRKGSYVFNKEKPPIIPTANLIYYDETKTNLPYIFSIKDFLPGISLLELYIQYNNESFNFSKSKFNNLFFRIGELLGKLHQISFNSYEDQFQFLGKRSNKNWLDLFKTKLNLELSKLRKFNIEVEDKIILYFKDAESLIEDEDEPVLNHNDFQWSNLIVEDISNEIKINGVIDYDNCAIGVRAVDFVKMKSEVLGKINNKELDNSFFEGYKKYFPINKEFFNKINVYTLLWAIESLNERLQINQNVGENISQDKEKDYIYQSFKKIFEMLTTT
ncbi:MAG: dihydrodipicolinate synthase family protein [Candidatus Thorarchaeota archaeon]